MLEGLYAAAAGMNAQRGLIDSIATNIANVSTTGYRAQRTAFADLVYNDPGTNKAVTENTRQGAGARSYVIDRSQALGDVRQTERNLDVALPDPTQFLALRQPDGTVALTRDGHLLVSADGTLTANDGTPLEPAVRVPAGTPVEDVTVRGNGTVVVADQEVGRLPVVTVAVPERLQATGGNRYQATDQSGAPQLAGDASRVHAGYLENSNVDLAEQLTAMVSAQRGYDLASRAIRIHDEVLQGAATIRR